MRDPRFVAVHRGGPLDRKSHALLALWAADCAELALPIFAQHSGDARPRQALETARAWARGEVPTGAAMKASVAAHAAAREMTDPAAVAAVAAARAAGQAVATAHCADHCMGALLYALKALRINGLPTDAERGKRLAKLPAPLREMVRAGVDLRLKAFGLNGKPP